ncbi:unnamed protein product [Closterium sp. NIES-54]
MAEPLTEPPTNPPTNLPTNPPTKPDTNPPSGSPTNYQTNHPTDTPINPSFATPTKPPSEPSIESPVKPPTQPPTKPLTKPPEPPTEAPTKPPTNPPLSKPDPSLWTRIPGSVLDSLDKIRSFREIFDCIGREGKWSYDDSPRLLPWPDEMSKCDLRHLNKSSRNVALQTADHLVGRFMKVLTQIEEITERGKEIPRQQIDRLKKLERWNGILRRQWAVRETLKYRWVVSGTNGGSRCGGPWDRFSLAKPDHKLKRQMRTTLLALWNAYPNLLIIVRNTPAGHPDYWPYEKPLSEKLLHIPRTDWYHWEKFGSHNKILKWLAEGVGGVYMDVNASAVWRPDGHVDGRKDCLHYCHPGPMDTWVQLLFNMLLGLLVPTG